MYDFRFNSDTADEISYLSKIMQLESAVYNFTLDESIQIKKYYSQKLKEYAEGYTDYKVHGQEQHPFVMGFINSILGDLHFYDQEYDDAIIYYDNALKPSHILKITTLAL